ncbi:MAG TPA: beta-glucanase [Balneolaceae bacterium]|mgnify:CR=1 FL=1|nr:beta-glucanase [Balneolaceae bacterium]|tara:strand:+ start:75242 stop:76081 length:840 start_codon:yes stop_codon:yes gene_type:complete
MKKFLYSLSIIISVLLISCSKTETQSPSSKWENATLFWSEDFNGTVVDTSEWIFQTGDHGWGNDELQDYQPFGSDNAIVKDGALHIVARKVGEGQNVGDYTSTRIRSRRSFKYGRMEVRAKMPDYKGPGLWPAIWMLGENIREVGWPDCGEIDIMEYVSWRPDSTLATIHSRANNHRDKTQISSGFVALPTIEEEFHDFGILWDEESLEFYVDDPDNILLSIPRPEDPDQDNWPFSNPHFFILNVAVGGGLGGVEGVDDSIFPASMIIDHVKVWKLEDQ